MIRLRVGDLISSNYSKFNLAGIFGLRDPNAKVNGRDIRGDGPSRKQTESETNRKAEDVTRAEANVKKAEAARDAEEAKKFEPGTGYQFRVVDGKYSPVPGSGKGKPIVNPSSQNLIAVIEERVAGEPTTYKVKFKKILAATQPTPQSGASSRPTLDINMLSTLYVVPQDMLGNLTEESQRKYDANLELANKNITNSAAAAEVARQNQEAARAASQPTEEQKATAEAANKNPKAAFMSEVVNFLDEKNNAITRSFKSAGGKGLAGFIDSINFDWYSGTTWSISSEGNEGRTAPKMCRITINFTPIHDISPGLDSDGYNRAPIYSVGPYRNRL
jgi:hypothetical protein